jgi:hypothetical protein
MTRCILALVLVPLLGLPGCGLAESLPAELKVRLTAPLSTKLNRSGDLVVGKVVAPANYAGAYLEGDIREIHAGAGGKGAGIQFRFHTLHMAGKTLPVSARLAQIANSRHQDGLDEDGVALEEDRAGGAGGFGHLPRIHVGIPLIGKDKNPTASGGASPVASVSSADSRTSRSAISQSVISKIGTKAPHISFGVGSEFTVSLVAVSK